MPHALPSRSFHLPLVATFAIAVVAFVNAAAPAQAATPGTSTLVRLTQPAAATYTKQYVNLQAHVEGGAHDPVLEFRTDELHAWSPIPGARLTTAGGVPVTLPLATDAAGDTPLLRWDLPATTSSDAGVAAENSIGATDGIIFIRAVATGAVGEPLAGEPGAVALTRSGPRLDAIEAPGTYDGAVLSLGPPIHVTWESASSGVALPDGGYIEVPIAGYAVDVLHFGDQLPEPVVVTTDTFYDVPAPPAADKPYVIVVRAVDAAGNAAGARTDEFVSYDVVLAAPTEDTIVMGDEAVRLRAPSAAPIPVCFQYRKGEAELADGESPPTWRPIPAAQVRTAAGRPIRRWPVTTTGTSRALRWKGLAETEEVNGLPGRTVEVRVARMRAPGGCATATGVGKGVLVFWTLNGAAYNLDPATPDPHDRFWGSSLPSESGKRTGSAGIVGPIYFTASVQRCHDGCLAAATDYAEALGEGAQRRSERFAEMRASNDGDTTALLVGCAHKLEVTGRYKRTVVTGGPIVGAHGVTSEGIDGGFELSSTGSLIAYVVGANCRSRGGSVGVQAFDVTSNYGHEYRACAKGCTFPAFPDDRHLAWIDAHRNLRIATIEDVMGLELKAPSTIIRAGVRAAAWSHDGKIVAIDDGSSRTTVLYARDGTYGFARTKPAFTTTHLPFAHTDVTGPISADSVHMLVTRYVGKRHDRPVLAVRNLHSGVVKTVQDTFRLHDSKTGKDIAIDFSTSRGATAVLHPGDWTGLNL